MKNFLRICIVALVLHQSSTKRDFTIDLNDLTVDIVDPDLIKFENHSIFNKKMFSVEFALRRTVKDLILKLKMDMIKKDNKPLNLFKIDVNGCNGQISQKVSYIKLLLQQFKRVSNIPIGDCVFLADTVYYIRNYTIVDEDYPPFYPTMSCKFSWEFIFDKKKAAVATLSGRVRKL